MSTITELEIKRDRIRDELDAASRHMSSTVRLLEIALVKADRDLLRESQPTKSYYVRMPEQVIEAKSMLDAYDKWLDYLQEFCEQRDAALFNFEESEPVNSEPNSEGTP